MASALFKASRLEGLLWALLLVTSTAAGPIVTRAEVVSADQIPANLVIASNQPLAHLAPPQCSPVCGASMVCVHSFTFGPICAADKSLNATAPGVATSLSVHSQDLQPRNPAVFVAEYFASMALDMAFGSIVGSGTDVSAQFEAIAEKMIVQIDGIVKAALTAAWEDRDKKCAKSLLVGIAEYRRTFLNSTDSDGIARTLTVVYDLMATAECNANLMLENLSDPSYSPHATPFWILMAAAKLGLWQERIYLQTLYVPLCSIPQCAKDLADFKKLAKADAVTFYGLLTDQFYFKSKRAIDQGMGERPFNEDSFDDDCIHKNFLGVCDKIDWKVGCHMDYWVRWADGGQTVGSVKGYQVSNYYHADATMHCKDQCQDEMDKWTAGFYLPALTTNSRPGTTILSPEYNNLKSLWKYLSTNSDPVGWTSCPGNTTP